MCYLKPLTAAVSLRCLSLTKLGVCSVCHSEKSHVSADICGLADNHKELSIVVIQLGVQRILTIPSGTVERTVFRNMVSDNLRSQI